MPKEEQKDEEPHDKSELEEEIKEDELGEIAEKVSDEDSTGELIDENQFREFLQIESTAPVLEEIAGEQELSTRFFPTSRMAQGSSEEEEAFRYDAQAPEDEEPKYQNSSSIDSDLARVDTTKIGRDIGQPKVREAGFVSSVNSNNDSPMQEKYQEAQRIDMGKVGRENPFETRVQEVERKKSDYVVK